MDKYLVITGRPNAGKSTIISLLTGLKINIGRHPGTTRRVTRYPLNEGLIILDTPGFGRMRGVSKKVVDRIKKKLVRFLDYNWESIVLAIHVIDLSTFMEVSKRLEKKGIIPIDVEMIMFLQEITNEFPFVVANKVDKINIKEAMLGLDDLRRRLGDSYSGSFDDNIFLISAKSGEGVGFLMDTIYKRLVSKGFKIPLKVK